MKIMTWDTPNFGDRLNELVWPHYLQNCLDEDPSSLLVGIGSLLNHRLPQKPTKWILGAGIGHGDAPTVDESWRVLWVRGPRSVDGLGLSNCRYITDGAVLLRDVYKPEPKKRFSVSFMLHTSAVQLGAFSALQEICESANIHLINPHSPPGQVLSEICQSDRLITEALHGAIVADSFRVPWTAVSRGSIFSFKWSDWAESVGLKYKPSRIPYRPQWFADGKDTRTSRRIAYPMVRPLAKIVTEKRLWRLAKSGPWQLSKDPIVSQKIDEMKECLADLAARLR